MKSIFSKKTALVLLTAAMSVAAVASCYGEIYYSGGTSAVTGPGANLPSSSSSPQQTTDDTASLDAADYASTGGVARGGMSISDAVPAGCTAVNLLSQDSTIVQVPQQYTYDFMFHDMDLLSQTYPSRAAYRTIGVSRDGRSIYEMILGNQNAQDHVLMTASIHGREYITANLVMKQAEFLLYADSHNGSFDGKRVSQWLDEVCVHIVPMANPDGVSISQFGLDGLRFEDNRNALLTCYQYDLANQRTSYDFSEYCLRFKANAIGVDLNQNFDALWNTASGTATQGSFSGYRGPSANSEPETQALTTLIDSRKWKAVVNYHAMGEVIYWDIEGNKLREHSRDLANNLSQLTGYQMMFSSGGGGLKDYVQLCGNASTSVTLEVGKTKAPVPWTEMDTIWNHNKYVPLYTMKWAQEKGK